MQGLTHARRRSKRTLGLSVVLLAGVGLTAFGCDEKKPSDATARSDAGTDKYATADPKLAKALQAAASASAGNDHGPPPEGIFGPGAADQRHPRGTPTKVDLAAPGSDPRLSWTSSDGGADTARSAVGPAVLEFGMIMGRSALPNVDLSLAFVPPKHDAPLALIADVRKAAPAKEQLGQLPPGMDRQIGTMEGAEIRIPITSDGRASDAQVQLGKNTNPDLDRIVQNAADSLLLLTVPSPPQPVGVGGQWIAESRMTWSGIDVVAYRAYRVKAIDGDRATLTLTVQAYATSNETQLAGVPKGATLEQFDAEAQGELEVVRGESLPRKAGLEQRMALIFKAPGARDPEGAGPGEAPGEPQGNVMAAKFQGQASFLRGDDLRAAAAR